MKVYFHLKPSCEQNAVQSLTYKKLLKIYMSMKVIKMGMIAFNIIISLDIW